MPKIGLIKEGKIIEDYRVAFTPAQCRRLMDTFSDVEVVVEPYLKRCFSDEEYKTEGIILQEDISDCDILIGIKEVPIPQLIPHKTYLFFSHTTKEQFYNRKILQTIIRRGIRLIDYERLFDDKGLRIIGFGRVAGIVGAHSGLVTWGNRTGNLKLADANTLKDFEQLETLYTDIRIPPIRIVITGGGRVSHGAMEVMDLAGIQKADKADYLTRDHAGPVYVNLDFQDYYIHKDTGRFEQADFFAQPENYVSSFRPFTEKTDLMINAIYWDERSPVFFTKEDMRNKDFRIKVIADITCDVDGSIPSTIRPSVMNSPVYGYDPVTETEVEPFQESAIDVMAVDTLPNALPRDSSEMFGEALLERVVPELLKDESKMIEGATITSNGDLTEQYEYLRDYVNEQ